LKPSLLECHFERLGIAHSLLQRRNLAIVVDAHDQRAARLGKRRGCGKCGNRKHESQQG